MLAVERERTAQAFLEVDGGLPAERLLDLPAVPEVVADVDRFRSSGNGTSLYGACPFTRTSSSASSSRLTTSGEARL